MGLLSRLSDLISDQGREALDTMGEFARDGLMLDDREPVDRQDQLKADYGRVLAELEKVRPALTRHEDLLATQNRKAEEAMSAGDESSARAALTEAMAEEERIAELRPVVEELEQGAAQLKALLQQSQAKAENAAREEALLNTRKHVAESKERAITGADNPELEARMAALRESTTAAEAKVDAVEELAAEETALEGTFAQKEKESELERRMAALKSKS
ncbi:MAG: PspA/IM30 family protein [Planctomycetota bacterium]|jgi:phage shock protein A